MFEVNLEDQDSKPRHIISWFQSGSCKLRPTIGCGGSITHVTQLIPGTFEVCGLVQNKAFCALYTQSAQGLMGPASEMRIADEFTNRALEPSTVYSSGNLIRIEPSLEIQFLYEYLIQYRAFCITITTKDHGHQ